MTDPRLTNLVSDFANGRLSRRSFTLRAAALGLSVPVIGASRARPATAAPGPTVSRRNRLQSDPTTLIIADNLDGPWITLDPAIIYEINSQAAFNVVYEPLYHLPDSTVPDAFEPLLGDGLPEIAADGLSATIKLRQGVVFQTTGNPMTSADWIFSWNRLKGQAGNPSFLAEYLGVYEAVDEYTLKLTLSAPNAALVAILSSAPLSVTDSVAITAVGGLDTPDTQEPADVRTAITAGSFGTGPYQVTKFDVTSEVIIERNPTFWGEPAAFERIIWRNEIDPNTQLQLVQTGEADIAYSVDPDAISMVESDENLQLLTGPTLAHDYLALNTLADPGGPLASKELRQAIGYAIDYDGIINGLSGGASLHPATIVPVPLLGAEDVLPLAYTLDLTKAQELFDASGLGTVELTFSYSAGASSSTGVSLDTYLAKLKDDLEKIEGLTINLSPVPAADRLQAYRDGKLQFTFANWAPDYPDVHTYAEPFGKTDGAAARRVGYSNARVDELLDLGISEFDPEARKAIYVEIQRILIEDAAFLVLEQIVDRKPASIAVQGVSTHSIYQLQLRYASKTA